MSNDHVEHFPTSWEVRDQHVEHCPKNENDPVIRQDTGAVRVDPNSLQEEQIVKESTTQYALSRLAVEIDPPRVDGG